MERGKLIIAFWFEILVTWNMTVQLLIWYGLSRPICFMLQAQTCLLNHSLMVRNALLRCGEISCWMPRSPGACPWDALGDVLTPSAVSYHPAPSICSPCLHLPLKWVPDCLWPLYSAPAKFNRWGPCHSYLWLKWEKDVRIFFSECQLSQTAADV